MSFGTTIDMGTLRTQFSLGTPTAITSFAGKLLYSQNGASYSVPAIGIGNPISFSYFQNAIYNNTAQFINSTYIGSGTNNSTATNINFEIVQGAPGTLTSTYEAQLSLTAGVGYRNLSPTLRMTRSIVTGTPANGTIQIFKNNVLNQTLSRDLQTLGVLLVFANDLNFNNNDVIKIILSNTAPPGCVVNTRVTCPIANGV